MAAAKSATNASCLIALPAELRRSGCIGALANREAWLTRAFGVTTYQGIGHALPRSRIRRASSQHRARSRFARRRGGRGDGNGRPGRADRGNANQSSPSSIRWRRAGLLDRLRRKRDRRDAAGDARSIGVVWLHLDHSAAFAKAGVKPTLLFAGQQRSTAPRHIRSRPGPARAFRRSSTMSIASSPRASESIALASARPARKRRRRRCSSAQGRRGGARRSGRRVASAVQERRRRAVADRCDRKVACFRSARAFLRPKLKKPPLRSRHVRRRRSRGPGSPIRQRKTNATTRGLRPRLCAAQRPVAAIMECEEATGRPKCARYIAFKTDLSVDLAIEELRLAGPENVAMRHAPAPAVPPPPWPTYRSMAEFKAAQARLGAHGCTITGP